MGNTMDQIRAFLSYIGEFNTVTVLLRIFLAVIAGGLIGNERGRHGRAAGFRTHILVCLGGAMTSLCSLFVLTAYGYDGDIFRIPAQVISGIGFLGAGIILVRNNNTVAGLTTAAGMWVTATIGVAFGYGFYAGGAVTTVICLINAVLLTRVEQNRIRAMRFYVEVNDVSKIQDVLDQIAAAFHQDVMIETIPAKSGLPGSVGFVVSTMSRSDYEKIKQEFNQIDEISFVVPG
ncbi:MAG: MgtC/SapB family protein [Oscillospiraceae bacterium]|nr:MgtC/SapB family protein [Oscillospiraceae bacterium]